MTNPVAEPGSPAGSGIAAGPEVAAHPKAAHPKPAAAHPEAAARPKVAHTPSDDEELIMFLERDQLVADTSKPVARARLGPRTSAALWGLRVFVIVVSFMVIYTFVHQLG